MTTAITPNTPRIAVFSDLPMAQWLDSVINLFPQNHQPLYTRQETATVDQLETNRKFWSKASRETPVLVFIDEEKAETTGNGQKADWSESYKRLLETLYQHTDKFAIVKTHGDSFTVGASRINEQMNYQTSTDDNPASKAKQHAQDFHVRQRRNVPVLGLGHNQRLNNIEQFTGVFQASTGQQLLADTKPTEDIV